jgi:molecular chaperone DnaK
MFLGVDLGTSNSAIVGSVEGATRLFKTAEGTDVLPSVIYIDKRGHRFVGGRAYDRTFTAPDSVAAGFKRLMGTSSTVAFKGVDKDWTPEECSAEVLRTLLAQARVEAGDFEIAGAVITVPAAFNQMQSEATLRAARMAGLERVALLQEPVAASMASIANSAQANGKFLIYDLGGGTFDVALVESVAGAVNVLAHEGVNMLGGRDFDRLVVDAHVRPWLSETFALPSDFQRDPRYQRLMGVARHAVEKARIDLSTSEMATIHAGDEEIRATDLDGSDLYLSIEIARADVEALIADRIDESLSLCRKMLRESGVAFEEVGRVVLVGGPTKMPMIRERVPFELGIRAEAGLDPMTAVATGAAIFAESRDWTDHGARRRVARRMEKTTGDVEITFQFPERVVDEDAEVRVRVSDSVEVFVEIRDRDGVTSGRVPVSGTARIAIRVRSMGANEYEVRVTDSAGAPVTGGSRSFTVHRGRASVAADQARQTIAVKVQSGHVGYERNSLEPLVRKGQPLPADGVVTVGAAKELRGGQPGSIAIEIYEQREDLDDPALALMVGDFRIDAERDLDRTDQIRRTDELKLHWSMDESGILTCSVETNNRILDGRNFYIPHGVRDAYGGPDGAAIASDLLGQAESDLDKADETLGQAAGDEIARLRQRIERQHIALSGGVDAERHRGAAEEARLVRQDIALLKRRPENREAVLGTALDEVERGFDELRGYAPSVALDRFDRLLATARRALREGDFDGAERAVRELESIHHGVLFNTPDFIIGFALHLGQQRHLAVDRRLHQQLEEETARAIKGGDLASLRAIIGRHLQNRLATGGKEADIPRLADLLRR